MSSGAGSEGQEAKRNSPETGEGEDFAQRLGGGDRDSGWWRRAAGGSGGGEPGGPAESATHREVVAPGRSRPAAASVPGRGTQRRDPLGAVIPLEGGQTRCGRRGLVARSANCSTLWGCWLWSSGLGVADIREKRREAAKESLTTRKPGVSVLSPVEPWPPPTCSTFEEPPNLPI